MSRFNSKHISTAIIIVAIAIAGTIVSWGHVQLALASGGGTYTWTEFFPAGGAPDSSSNLEDIGAPCRNTANGPDCAAICDASHVGQWCDTLQCSGNSAGDGGEIAYDHDFDCEYTPPPACVPDNSAAATTCTTSTYPDGCGNFPAGTENCAVSCTVSNSCHSLTNSGIIVNGVCNAAPPSEAPCTPPPPTCANGGTDYPTCTPPSSPPPPSCANGGTDYPICTPPSSPPPSCANGGTDYPICTPPGNPDSGGPGGTCSSPAATITASPNLIKSGGTTTLTITGTGLSHTCTITGPGMNQTLTPASCTLSPNPTVIVTPAITSQSTYTVTCGDITSSTKVIVNVNSTFTPF